MFTSPWELCDRTSPKDVHSCGLDIPSQDGIVGLLKVTVRLKEVVQHTMATVRLGIVVVK